MMRSAVLLSASLLCWTHQASAADCKSELAAVREAAVTAGPVRTVERFTSYLDETRPLLIVIDLIRPDRLRRISIFEAGKVGQMVLIAGFGWAGNIGSTWEPLGADFATKMLASVMQNSPWPTASVEVTCVAGDDATMTFAFSATDGDATVVHEVVADQQTKGPLRYRARTSMKGSPYSATDRSFEFISTLAIEAP